MSEELRQQQTGTGIEIQPWKLWETERKAEGAHEQRVDMTVSRQAVESRGLKQRSDR